MTSTPASNVLNTITSAAAVIMVVGSLSNLLPNEFKSDMYLLFRRFVNRCVSPQLTLVIPESDGLVTNEMYEAAEIYLGGTVNPTTRRLRLTKPEKEKSLKFTMEKDEIVHDNFGGTQLKWKMECQKDGESVRRSENDSRPVIRRTEVRYFQLSFHVKEKEKVFGSYLPHVLKKAKSIASEKKTLKIFTVDYDLLYQSWGNAWRSTNLEHPSTFDTLALEPKLKKTILDDIDGFVKRKEFYKRVGKAWKRGYLLYGPPGTGKSSLIAAIANYLNFDIYDLDLTELSQNSELKKVMLTTANRSILVVEDIDCNVVFRDREVEGTPSRSDRKVTLSAVLNFIDGLWSTCGDERIIIFTTNHKDKLDPAMLRPGRMDMHIHLSYCTPAGFKVLAFNYLGMKHHPLFKVIKKLIKKVEVTPADVAEKLMKNDEPDIVIQDLLDFLVMKKTQRDEAKSVISVKETQGQEQEDKEETSDEEEDTSDDDNDTDEAIQKKRSSQ